MAGYESSNTTVLGIGTVLTLLDVAFLVMMLIGRHRRKKKRRAAQ